MSQNRLYEMAERRQGLLYRLPDVPAPKRTLEIVLLQRTLTHDPINPFGDSAICNLHLGPHPLITSDSTSIGSLDDEGRCAISVASGSFDLVILHSVVEEIFSAARSDKGFVAISSLLNEAKRVLVPAGIVAGCFHSKWSWLSARRLVAGRPSRSRLPPWSVATCKAALQSCDMSRIEVFNLLPSVDNPMHLINTDRAVPTRGHERLLLLGASAGRRRFMTKRRLAHAVSLDSAFNWNYMFWATKPSSC